MKNICIVRLSAVGDVCHVTAIARSIQDHYPNTKITWIIGKVESRLISKTNDIEFIVFDKKCPWFQNRTEQLIDFFTVTIKYRVLSSKYGETFLQDAQWLILGINNLSFMEPKSKHSFDA